MTCTCETCSFCNGTGLEWFAPDGTSLGPNGGMDDLDFHQTCEECGGDGIVDLCDHCWEQEIEDAYDDEPISG